MMAIFIPPTLQTERLLLEPVSLEHAPSLQRHFARWAIIKNLSINVPWPYPEDGMESFIRDLLLPEIEAAQTMAWALIPRPHLSEPSDGPIGLLEWRRDPGRRDPESGDHRGFWIAEEWQGRGLMTEAVTAFQDFVFLELGIDRLVVLNADVNSASRRVKEKTGARLLGIVSVPHHNGCTRTQKWEVTRASWCALRDPT